MARNRHGRYVIGAAVIAACMLQGCSGSNTVESTAAGTTRASEEILASGDIENSRLSEENAGWEPEYDEGTIAPDGTALVTGTYDLSDCITLCDYEGMTIKYDGKPDITYEDARLRCMFQGGCAHTGCRRNNRKKRRLCHHEH